jgi:hypothetical protein
MSCSICHHPKRQEIDQALVAGSATLAALSQEYGLSTSALHRHKAHLQAQVNRGKDRLQDHLRQGCLFWLTQALEMIMQTASAAQAEGNHKLVLKGLAQGTRLVAIILKHDLPLDDMTVFELLSSPQWADQSGLLPHDPNIMTLSRQSLHGIFSSPCPEGEDRPDSSFSPDDLAMMQQLFQGLPSLATPGRACRPQREKSGKLAAKTPARKENQKEYQEDLLWEKISGMMSSSSLTGHLPLETSNSKLASILEELAKGDKLPADKPLSEYIYEQTLKPGQDNQAAEKDCRGIS